MQSLDTELVSRLLAGDSSALQFFYNTHTPQLLSFIRRKIGSEEDVEEIAQDALFGFLEGLRDFHGQCKIRTFLFAIAHNKIVDYYRKRRLKKVLFSQLPYGFEQLVSDLLTPEEEYDQKLVEEKIAAVFKKLTPTYARTLALKYIEGMSVEEIAADLSCTFKAAESLLFRARKAFVKAYAGSAL